MLKNIIFDMGGVLITYNPRLFVDRLPLDEQDRELLLREIFLSADWPLCDAGEIDEPQLEQRVLGRIPARLHQAAHRLIFSWERPSPPSPAWPGW